MEKDTSNPFHYMNESQIEIQNASSIIENEYGIYQEFCDTGKSYLYIKLNFTYNIYQQFSKNIRISLSLFD